VKIKSRGLLDILVNWTCARFVGFVNATHFRPLSRFSV
jgi:hypothetical protein